MDDWESSARQQVGRIYVIQYYHQLKAFYQWAKNVNIECHYSMNVYAVQTTLLSGHLNYLSYA